jgi:hypothetical protein
MFSRFWRDYLSSIVFDVVVHITFDHFNKVPTSALESIRRTFIRHNVNISFDFFPLIFTQMLSDFIFMNDLSSFKTVNQMLNFILYLYNIFKASFTQKVSS